jgi:hypothetical protein
MYTIIFSLYINLSNNSTKLNFLNVLQTICRVGKSKNASPGDITSDLYSGCPQFESQPDTNYPHKFFLWFPSFPPGKYQDFIMNLAMIVFFHVSQFIIQYHLVT